MNSTSPALYKTLNDLKDSPTILTNPWPRNISAVGMCFYIFYLLIERDFTLLDLKTDWSFSFFIFQNIEITSIESNNLMAYETL